MACDSARMASRQIVQGQSEIALVEPASQATPKIKG
jgi:hypothetical protein